MSSTAVTAAFACPARSMISPHSKKVLAHGLDAENGTVAVGHPSFPLFSGALVHAAAPERDVLSGT